MSQPNAEFTPPPPVPYTEHHAEKVVRQSKDKAQYVRQQQGHSLIKHIFFGWTTLWIKAIYITFSPNHYWHA